jgi:formylglycine-generating enzyme required for sulfatase activity
MGRVVPRGFRTGSDVLVRLFRAGDEERVELLGSVPAEIRGQPAAIDWEAAGKSLGADLRVVVPELRQLAEVPESGEHREQHRKLGRAVGCLLPEAWRPALAANGEGRRWIVHAEEAGLDACLVPWEAMQDGLDAPVATERVPLLRYVDIPAESPSLARPDRFRFLLLVGSTEQKPWEAGAGFDLVAELEAIERAVAELGICDLVVASAGGIVLAHGQSRAVEPIASREDLAHLLQRGFHVVHYVGHAEEELHEGARGLRFAPPVGVVAPEELDRALQGGCTRLLVLDACCVPDPMARALLRAVEHVVAMGARVTSAFTAGWCAPFYRELLQNQRPVSSAVTAARASIPNRWRRWVPGHWTRNLDDRPILSREEYELQRHRAAVVKEHGPLLGALAGRVRSDDAIEALTVDLELEPLASPEREAVSVADLVRRGFELFPARKQHYLLLGRPGGGKTTSLRKLAKDLAHEGDFDPYYEHLARWPRSGGELVPFWSHVETRSSSLRSALLAKASQGRLVLLLDGLDECQDPDAVRSFLAHELTPELRAIVASREVYHRGALPADFGIEARLAPLNPKKQRALLLKWFTAESAPEPERSAGELLRRLGGSRYLRELAETPLYLTLSALLWSGGEVPKEHPHELHEQCMDYLLRARHRSPRPELPQPPAALSRRALRWAALRAIWQGEPEARAHWLTDKWEFGPDGLSTSTRDLRRDVADWLEDQDVTERDLFERIARWSGLLEGNPVRDRWTFPHRTFREALAAEELGELYKRERLRGLQEGLAPALEGADGEVLSSWTEALALTTGWIQEEDHDAWVMWLRDRHPRIAYRALHFALVSTETLVSVLGWSDKRRERWRSYDRALDGALPEQVETLDGLVSALGGLNAHPEEGVRRGVVPDLAFLDHSIAAAARQAVAERRLDLGPRIAEVRQRLIGTLPEPGESEVVDLFRSVPGHQDLDLFGPVPAGKFLMGSPEGEEGRLGNEKQVEVELTRPYWIARVPVTRAQYRLFDPRKYHHRVEPDLPMTGVTWYEASLFVRWLDHVLRKSLLARLRLPPDDDLCLRLPTEAEWEHACRDAPGLPKQGERYPRYVSGDTEEDLARVAWYVKNSVGRVHPVAQRAPSPKLEVFDMLGNAWEWTSDWYFNELRAGRDPVGPALGAWRVLRGGSYWFDARVCRAAYRDGGVPGFDDGGVGFRVVLAPPLPAR